MARTKQDGETLAYISKESEQEIKWKSVLESLREGKGVGDWRGEKSSINDSGKKEQYRESQGFGRCAKIGGTSEKRNG